MPWRRWQERHRQQELGDCRCLEGPSQHHIQAVAHSCSSDNPNRRVGGGLSGAIIPGTCNLLAARNPSTRNGENINSTRTPPEMSVSSPRGPPIRLSFSLITLLTLHELTFRVEPRDARIVAASNATRQALLVLARRDCWPVVGRLFAIQSMPSNSTVCRRDGG